MFGVGYLTEQVLKFHSSSSGEVTSLFSVGDLSEQILSFNSSSFGEIHSLFGVGDLSEQTLGFKSSSLGEISSLFSVGDLSEQTLSFNSSSLGEISSLFGAVDLREQTLGFHSSSSGEIYSLFGVADSNEQTLGFHSSSSGEIYSLFGVGDLSEQTLNFDFGSHGEKTGIFEKVETKEQVLTFNSFASGEATKIRIYADSEISTTTNTTAFGYFPFFGKDVASDVSTTAHTDASGFMAYMGGNGSQDITTVSNVEASGILNYASGGTTSISTTSDMIAFGTYQELYQAFGSAEFSSEGYVDNLSGNLELEELEYTVTFYSEYTGSNLRQITVYENEEVQASDYPDVDEDPTGYTFDGWSIPKEFAPFTVSSNTTITAEYTIDTYTVEFVDYDGTSLDEQTVDHGDDATPPPDPTREDYIFDGWDGDYTDVTSDRTITATYTQPEMDLILADNWDSYLTSGNFGREYNSRGIPSTSNNVLEIKIPDETNTKAPTSVKITHWGEDVHEFFETPYSKLEVHLLNSSGSTEEQFTLFHTYDYYQEETFNIQDQIYMYYIRILAYDSDIDDAETYRRYIRNVEVTYSDGTVVNKFV